MKIILHLKNFSFSFWPHAKPKKNNQFTLKSKTVNRKDTRPRRGTTGTALGGGFTLRAASLFAVSSLHPPAPSRVKPTCFPEVSLIATTPTPSPGTEATAIAGHPPLPSHVLFPSPGFAFLIRQSVLMGTVTKGEAVGWLSSFFSASLMRLDGIRGSVWPPWAAPGLFLPQVKFK